MRGIKKAIDKYDLNDLEKTKAVIKGKEKRPKSRKAPIK